MSDTFTFDGIVSSAYGVYAFPTDTMMSTTAHQYTEYSIPGRSGSLLVDESRFPNTTRTYGVIIPASGSSNLDGLRNALASRVGYFRLTDTFDTTHYYMAAYRETYSPTLDWREKRLAKAKITFNCKPQRFLNTGETTVSFSNSGTITNPTRFASMPLLRVYGSGVLGVAGTNITISPHGYSYIDIDCETCRAYYSSTALDDKIALNKIDFPKLAPGSNTITKGSGITSIVITPRWWEL